MRAPFGHVGRVNIVLKRAEWAWRRKASAWISVPSSERRVTSLIDEWGLDGL